MKKIVSTSLHYMIRKYLRGQGVLKLSGLDKETKDLIKQALAKI